MQSIILLSAARAVGISASPLYFFALTPLTLLLITLPVSIHGIGVVEASHILFLGLAGLAPEQSLSISLLLRVVEFAMLIPAGLVYLHDSATFKRVSEAA
jgi:uncharacterized membrane protein YbhN (UPF0104 family)